MIEQNEQIETPASDEASGAAIVRRGTVFMAHYAGKPRPAKVVSINGNFAKCISCDLKFTAEFRLSAILKSLEKNSA